MTGQSGDDHHDIEAPQGGVAAFNDKSYAGSPGEIRGGGTTSTSMTDLLDVGSSSTHAMHSTHNHIDKPNTIVMQEHNVSSALEGKPALVESAVSVPILGSGTMDRPDITAQRRIESERKSRKNKSEKKKKKKSNKESKRSVTGGAMVAMVSPSPTQHQTDLATIKQEGLPDWLLDHLEHQYNAARSAVVEKSNVEESNSLETKEVTESTRSGPGDDEIFDLYDDIYSMMFLAPIFSSAMLFSILAFLLKICLYLFLAIELGRKGSDAFQTGPKDRLVVAAQFFMLPVAVAIQEDLIGSYALVANIRYDKKIKKEAPDATCSKWVAASICRFVDGLMSLGINFCLLLLATDVLSLFLNFAALQFLQTIDNVAFGLAKDGYLTDAIEDVAELAATLTLPKKCDRFMNSLDTVLFLVTFMFLLIGWIIVTVRQQSSDPIV